MLFTVRFFQSVLYWNQFARQALLLVWILLSERRPPFLLRTTQNVPFVGLILSKQIRQ